MLSLNDDQLSCAMDIFISRTISMFNFILNRFCHQFLSGHSVFLLFLLVMGSWEVFLEQFQHMKACHFEVMMLLPLFLKIMAF